MPLNCKKLVCGAPLHMAGVAESEVDLNLAGDRLAVTFQAGEEVLVFFVDPRTGAAGSVLAAIERGEVSYPLLVTTGDHPLLTAEMVRHFADAAWRTGADVAVGLATAETILAAHPRSVRTFFRLGATRVSGCYLFAVRNARALALLRLWQDIEKNRKKPWRIVSAFGPVAIIRFLTGTPTLDGAFALVSRRLGLTVAPVLMPFAEAAIDVDKPADKELAEAILAARDAGNGP